LIAIITNNFSICNGRFPDDDFNRHDFIGATAPPALASFIAATSVAAVAILGIVFTLLVSAFLSKTLAQRRSVEFQPGTCRRIVRRKSGRRFIVRLLTAR
jgi:hypothetical protein